MQKFHKWCFRSQHHLHSYQLQKHACWSIIATTLLWIWLRKQHIQSFYLQSIISINDLDSLKKSNLIMNIIVVAFASVIKSNALFMTDNLSTENHANLFKAVSKTWHKFIELLKTAALIVYSNSRSCSATSKTSKSAIFTRTTAASKSAVDLKTKTESFQAD